MTNGSSDEEDEPLVTKDQFGNYQDFNRKTNPNIHSVYVLNSNRDYKGRVWPMSQFEKVDVLECALTGRNKYFNVEPSTDFSYDSDELRLPLEIMIYIFEIMYSNGYLRAKHLRISKLFYAIVLPMIYRKPKLKATNFFSFVETIANNKTIGDNIQQLDLSYIIQTGKNAYVSKLLKRSKKNLQLFVAPQTSFGFTPLFALRNCTKLKVLDLRLVSETLNLEDLFQSIKSLTELTHLSFPRSSVSITDYDSVSWPPKLSFLRISGGISDEFLRKSNFPSTITQLEFAHCPNIKDFGLRNVLLKVGNNLKSLKVQYPMPGLSGSALDVLFRYCPNIVTLEVTVDYMSQAFFDESNLPHIFPGRKLKSLYIDSSGMLGTASKIDSIDLALALNEGRLPNLKNLRCTVKLGWDTKSEYVNYIVEELEEREGGLYVGY